ncbi:hypothetical protein KFE25_013052 [Diacronema lutheri]|uniref:Zn(2)-C6 fungal-type domain-containing protein n=1 Tax=Diacronema lutheri TaxID=2081491 RepID=A0A8J5X2S4_DIALT|nr:hypothetical protein KFE25_013052 [Diacronema lutheri]
MIACQACRASKVKCDVALRTAAPCSRCERLCLSCAQPPPAKRGRPTAVAPRTADVVSGVRTFVQADGGWRLAAPPLASPSAENGCAAPLQDEGAFVPPPSFFPAASGARAKHAPERQEPPAPALSPASMMVHKFREALPHALRRLGTDVRAQAVAIRQFVTLARALNDSSAMGYGLLLADQLGLGVDDVVHFAAEPRADCAQPLPAFLLEWHESSCPTLCRYVDASGVHFLPNRQMRLTFLPAEASHDQPVSMRRFATSPLVASLMVSPTFARSVSALLASCICELSSAAAATAFDAAVLHHTSAQNDEVVRIHTADGRMRPFRLSARACSREHGRVVITALRFEAADGGGTEVRMGADGDRAQLALDASSTAPSLPHDARWADAAQHAGEAGANALSLDELSELLDEAEMSSTLGAEAGAGAAAWSAPTTALLLDEMIAMGVCVAGFDVRVET